MPGGDVHALGTNAAAAAAAAAEWPRLCTHEVLLNRIYQT